MDTASSASVSLARLEQLSNQLNVAYPNAKRVYDQLTADPKLRYAGVMSNRRTWGAGERYSAIDSSLVLGYSEDDTAELMSQMQDAGGLPGAIVDLETGSTRSTFTRVHTGDNIGTFDDLDAAQLQLR